MAIRQSKIATVLIAALVVIVGVIALWGNESLTVNRSAVQRTASELMRPTPESGKKNIVLFFVAGDGSSFYEETREIGSGATTTEDVRRTLTELIKGPKSGDLIPTIPREVQILNLFIDSFGTAYVDFTRDLQTGLPGGTQEEVHAVFSIVNTLTSNFVQITRVQILIEGAEIPTLTGHVNTRMALSPQYIF